jgi:hypothetical protein
MAIREEVGDESQIPSGSCCTLGRNGGIEGTPTVRQKDKVREPGAFFASNQGNSRTSLINSSRGSNDGSTSNPAESTPRYGFISCNRPPGRPSLHYLASIRSVLRHFRCPAILPVVVLAATTSPKVAVIDDPSSRRVTCNSVDALKHEVLLCATLQEPSVFNEPSRTPQRLRSIGRLVLIPS